jgi:ATP-dependent Lon protease
LREGEFEITDGALMQIIGSYTYEAGVRNLEREISSLCRKSVVRILEETAQKVIVTEENIHEFLGPPKIIQDVANREPEVGIVTGLAWTPVGGDLLFIETIKMRGSGKVRVTGRLGDVMGESVQAAYSFVRSRAPEMGIEEEDFDNYDVHIHFPEGAIPKDGPSAGVAVTIALISLFTGQPVNHLVAMTGEITLQGKVLPIGGLKEKTLAAYRGGIKKVLFPDANQKDLVEIPEEVRNGLEMIPIKTIAEALEHSVSKIVLPTGEVVEAIENMSHAQRRTAQRRPDEGEGGAS